MEAPSDFYLACVQLPSPCKVSKGEFDVASRATCASLCHSKNPAFFPFHSSFISVFSYPNSQKGRQEEDQFFQGGHLLIKGWLFKERKLPIV